MRGLTADRRRTAQIELAEHSSAHIFGYHDQGCTGCAGKREGSDLQANVEGVLVNEITPLRLEAYKDGRRKLLNARASLEGRSTAQRLAVGFYEDGPYTCPKPQGFWALSWQCLWLIDTRLTRVWSGPYPLGPPL